MKIFQGYIEFLSYSYMKFDSNFRKILITLNITEIVGLLKKFGKFVVPIFFKLKIMEIFKILYKV